MTQDDQPKPEPTPAAREPFRWRRLLQYKLRTLLFVVIPVCAAFFAWWSYTAKQQRAAVAALQEAGAEIVYDFEQERLPDFEIGPNSVSNRKGNVSIPLAGSMGATMGLGGSPSEAEKTQGPRFWPTWLVNTLGVDYFATVRAVYFDNATDAELVHLKGLGGLYYLNLSGSNVGDAGMVHLKGLSNLRTLDLSGTDAGDGGSVHLRKLTRLELLDLNSTKIGDVGASHLKNLARLKVLKLHNTLVGNAGLAQLGSLKGLEYLDLSGTRVTDAGLEHLKKLVALEELDLINTRITKQAGAELEKTLSDCSISYDIKDGFSQEGVLKANAGANRE